MTVAVLGRTPRTLAISFPERDTRASGDHPDAAPVGIRHPFALARAVRARQE
ncbi:hypothetical protein [Microbacterium aurantiacum]|uniref:hypothetical protein n=1 Tax=Microbacterium aurantiacum TaxID=162393 RepID=UPI003D720973